MHVARKSGLDMGHFFLTQPNPTHEWSGPMSVSAVTWWMIAILPILLLMLF